MCATTVRGGESLDCDACSAHHDSSTTALLERAAESGMLAPSAYNTQPWQFRIVGEALELHADASRARPIADPDGREMLVACGGALENVRIALRHLRREVEIALLPDPARPHFVARVRAGRRRPATLAEARFFTAIPQRRSNRARFYARSLPFGIAPSIEQAVESSGAALRLIYPGTGRDALSQIIHEADRAQAHDAQFRLELAEWLRTNQTERDDGMPGFAFGLSTPMAALAPLALHTFAWDRMRVVRDDDLAREAPLLAVLMTREDEPHAWIIAGQGMERALLFATSQGLATGLMNQAIQVAEARARVRKLLGTELWPQAILRFGFGPEVRATPRRALREVLVSTGQAGGALQRRRASSDEAATPVGGSPYSLPVSTSQIGGSQVSNSRPKTTTDEARRVGSALNVAWDTIDVEQFRRGMDVEFEHGAHDPQTDVTHDDLLLTGKIALAHLKEFPDYYARLERMEEEAKSAAREGRG